MRPNKYSYLAALATILMSATGCGGTVSVKQNFDKSLAGGAEKRTYTVTAVSATTSDASPEFLELVRDKLKAELSERNMLGNQGTATGVEVTVDRYRMRGEAMRQLVGFLLSGADTVATTVTVKTPSGDTNIGRSCRLANAYAYSESTNAGYL